MHCQQVSAATQQAHLIKDMIHPILILEHAIGVIYPARCASDVESGLQKFRLLLPHPSYCQLHKQLHLSLRLASESSACYRETDTIQACGLGICTSCNTSSGSCRKISPSTEAARSCYLGRRGNVSKAWKAWALIHEASLGLCLRGRHS